MAERVTAEELVELDRRRAWCPKSAEYSADFWGGHVKCRDPVAWRAMQSDEWRATMDAVAAAEVARPAPAPPVEQLALPPALRVPEVPTGLRIGLVETRVEVVDVEEEHEAEAMPKRMRLP